MKNLFEYLAYLGLIEAEIEAVKAQIKDGKKGDTFDVSVPVPPKGITETVDHHRVRINTLNLNVTLE